MHNSSGISSSSPLATATGQRAGQGLQNASMTKPTNGMGRRRRSQVEAVAKTTQPVASVTPVGSSVAAAGWSTYRSNLGTPSRSAHARFARRAAKGRMATCERARAQLGHENAQSELVAVAIAM